MKGFIILAFIGVLPGFVFAQFGSEQAGMNSLKKGKWDRAKAQFEKVIRKDSVNASANFGLSLFFFTPANPDFQIDSAYRYATKATEDYPLATAKQRDRFRRLPLDSTILIRHRQRIDSAAFEQAKSVNTEIAYIDFLSRFPLAVERDLAAELRNEVAYIDALKENTHEAFLKYLKKYPTANRAEEASSRYEKLLFEAKTKDKRLSSYESFLIEYPSTHYIREVENQIFEIAIVSGEIQDIAKYVKKYPGSSRANTARNILYHLYKEEDLVIPTFLLNDSIRRVQSLEKFFLVPFLKNDLFGFMNELGEEVLPPNARELDPAYICGNIVDEVLIVDSKIVARNGSILYKGTIDEVDDLGFGFLKVSTPTCVKVVHLSGFVAGDPDGCLQDVKLLGKNYLAIKNAKYWSVWSFSGRMLLSYEWDDIQQIGDVLALRKSGKFRLVALKDLASVADQLPLKLSIEYDDVKSWPKESIWVRMGNNQGVLSQNLNPWVPLTQQKVEHTFFGATSQQQNGFKLYGHTSADSKLFSNIIVNEPWVGVREEVVWRLINPSTKKFISAGFDSISFVGPFAVGLRRDSMKIFLSGNNFIEAIQNTKVQFLPGKDSLFFLLLEEGDKKTLFNINGERQFAINVEKIEYNNDGFFTVTNKEKRGLVSMDGMVVVQPEFDALGTVRQGMMASLKDKRFGFLDVVSRREIKPEYEKNIIQYSATKLIAYKNGFYGLVGWDNKPSTLFEFEEIRYWNDSAALVKKSFNWIIYNFIEKRVVLDKIKDFKWVLNSDQEKIMIFRQENKYGVISNKRGVVISPTFSDIINLGSPTSPLYFTEKHVEEAAIFVVIYYDKNGVQLRKQVYETDDYEKIYCSEK